MSDNTTVSTTDTIRDLDRNSTGIKTQVMQLDFGGPTPNLEQLVSPTNPLPTIDGSGNTTLLLANILTELRVITHFLKNGLNVSDEPDTLRTDPYYSQAVTPN